MIKRSEPLSENRLFQFIVVSILWMAFLLLTGCGSYQGTLQACGSCVQKLLNHKENLVGGLDGTEKGEEAKEIIRKFYGLERRSA